MKKEYAVSILVVVLLIVFYVWYVSSGELLYSGDLLLALGRLTGLLLAVSVLFQFVIIGRVGWLEKTFGLDTLSRAHHWVGFSTVFFLIAHPLLIGLAYTRGSGDSIFHKIFSFLFSGDEIIQATIGAILFLMVGVSSVYVLLKKLRYEYWYGIHLITYIAIIISFGHQTELGGDLQTILARVFWIALYAIAALVYVWFRFIQPIAQYMRHRFSVTEVLFETENVYSIFISGANMESFQYIPGQFVIVRFLEKGVWYEAHPFSISSGSGAGDIRLTIKQSGDYTKKLPQHIHLGTKVLIDGPHGIFGSEIKNEEKILCIAGGIGITPIRSIVEQGAKDQKKIKVLASFRTHHDVIFEREISALIGPENVHIVYTHESPYEGHIKTITHSTIFDYCPDIRERLVYLCGPVPFMNAMRAILKTQGVSEEKIHYEQFSL